MIVEGRAPEALAARGIATGRPDAYYAYPPLKPPHWKWHIPLYFFVGGLAAGSLFVSVLADLFGGRGARPLVRTGRYLAAPLIGVGHLLLIEDLGRRDRAHHMFRIVKTRSPMSLGSWLLAAFSAVSGALFAHQLMSDIPATRGAARALAPITGLAQAAALPASIAVGSYTGVLLSATATPLWAKARRHLAALFMSSAVTTGAALTAAAVALAGQLRPSAARGAAGVVVAGLAAELATEVAMEEALGESGRHLLEGAEGMRHRAGMATAAAAIALLLPTLGARRGPGVARTLAAAALVLGSGLAMRFSIVSAGKRSAEDSRSAWDWGG